jgi:AmiR/NasT family two-component response regulator
MSTVSPACTCPRTSSPSQADQCPDRPLLHVLVANQRSERAEAVAEIARSLGHEVVGQELNVEQVVELTRKEHPDVALVGLGESSQHALELIEQIVRNAACPVVLVLDARDQDFVNEAAQRGVFAHIVETDKNQLQSAIDITLRRFAEYHNLEEAFELLRDHSQRDGRKLVDTRKLTAPACLPAAARRPWPTRCLRRGC